jgi:glycosyltransferase involved in cell wall biosynthesis
MSGIKLFSPVICPLISIERKLKNDIFKADIIIVHSDFVKQKVEEFTKIPVKVIPYPYLGEINRTERKIGKKLKLLFIGRIIKQKGVHIIPEIARELNGNNIDYEIDVIGDGPLLQRLRVISKNLNIKYHGAIYDEKIKKRFFLNSDILLVPSLGEEPFGIVILEAMAHGLPIISSDRGGLGEIVKTNEIGIICEPKVKDFVGTIKKLSSNETLYQKLSVNCYEKIKNYSSVKIFEKYRKLFENLFKS